MSDSETIPRLNTPARLAPLLVDTCRRLRLARLLLQRSSARRIALSETLKAAIELLSEKDRELDAVRRTNQALRAELRRYTSKHVASTEYAA